MTENELISMLKKQEDAAFEILVLEYTKPIYYLAYNILNTKCSKEDMEECASDVLVEIWQKISDFDEERGNFKTWVFMLTKYKALKYRREKSKSNLVNIDDYEIAEPDCILKTVIDREEQLKLIDIINSFNIVDKQLFIRRYFYDEKIGILMESFNLSRSAIDNRLLRGRKIIKERLAYD